MARTDRNAARNRSSKSSTPRAVLSLEYAPRTSAARGEPGGAARLFSDPRLLAVLLVVVTVAAFSPLLTAEFSLLDDPQTIGMNPALNPPTLAKLAHVWDPRHPYMDLYVPVTYTVWSAVALIARVDNVTPGEYALNSWVYHGLNVALHAAAAVVAFALLRRLVRQPLAAAAGALLFAVHPVQVEAVGWTSGTKDVLWGLLGLVAIWQYLQFAGATGGRKAAAAALGPDALGKADDAPLRPWAHYAVATVAFVLAMLSKPTAIVIPFVAGLLDVVLLRRPLRRVLPALLPWLLLVVPVIIEGKIAQPAVNNPRQPHVPLAVRPLVAADALGYYLYKLALPARLGIQYDRNPDVVRAHGWHYVTWLAPAAVAAFAVWAWRRRRIDWAPAAVGVFWLGVAPVLGFAPFDFQFFSTVADHYLYFAMLGPALAVAFVLSGRRTAASEAELGDGIARPAGRAAWAVAAVVLVALAARSHLQAYHWRDSFALFRHAVDVNPRSNLGWRNLGQAYASAGRTEDALRADRAAAAVDPWSRGNYAASLANSALTMLAQAEAARAAGRASEANALSVDARRRLDAAEGEYAAALRLDLGPDERQAAEGGLAKLHKIRDLAAAAGLLPRTGPAAGPTTGPAPNAGK